MDVPPRVGQPLLVVLPLIAVEKLLIVVDVAWNDVEVESLRPAFGSRYMNSDRLSGLA